MTDNEKLSCLIDRPCSACKFHKENGCSKWSCVFEDKSGVPVSGSRYVRIVEVESVIHNDLHALLEKEQIDQLKRDINGLNFITVPEGDSDDISHIFDNVPQEELEKIAKALAGWDTEKIRKEIQEGKE